jgi:hypothetical protein
MTHRTHSSFNRRSSKPRKDWAKHHVDMQTEQQRRLAEGMHRPEPSTSPPLTHDEWTANFIARHQEGEEQTP